MRGQRDRPDREREKKRDTEVWERGKGISNPAVFCSMIAEPVDGAPGGRARALRGGISKSIFQRRCQYLAINAHEMAPRMGRWLQERGRDAPT